MYKVNNVCNIFSVISVGTLYQLKVEPQLKTSKGLLDGWTNGKAALLNWPNGWTEWLNWKWVKSTRPFCLISHCSCLMAIFGTQTFSDVLLCEECVMCKRSTSYGQQRRPPSDTSVYRGRNTGLRVKRRDVCVCVYVCLEWVSELRLWAKALTMLPNVED